MHILDSNPLRRAVDHAAHLLPVQGPIGVFIHHNTLHSFQHRRFEEAVAEAAGTFGAEPYMTEAAFRREFAQGRIQQADVDWALEREPNAEVLPRRLDRRTLRRAMLDPRMPAVDALSLPYLIEETGYVSATAELRALWSSCLARVEQPGAAPAHAPARPRDGVWWSGGPDLDEIVHPLLIRLCAVYTDQGMAYWPMPGREGGFYETVRDLFAKPGAFYPAHLSRLGEEFRRQTGAGLKPEAVVREMLRRLGVAEDEWQHYLEAELLALPGWAGLIRVLERDPGLAPHVRLPCSLMDFLAVRLTFTAVALGSVAGSTTAWRSVTGQAEDAVAARRLEAARLFEAAKISGLAAGELNPLSQAAFAVWRSEVAAFSELERRRVWHLAYERRHELLILGPLGRHRLSHPPARQKKVRPVAQVFFCIDEREESIRRGLEECDPEIETFGAARVF